MGRGYPQQSKKFNYYGPDPDTFILFFENYFLGLFMKLVYIKWLDHCSFDANEWHKPEDFKTLEPITVQTVGWVINETPTSLTLVATNGGDTHTGEMCIIKSCIVKRKGLKL